MRRIVPVLVVIVLGLLVAVNLLGGGPEISNEQDNTENPEETTEVTPEESELTPVEEAEEYTPPSRYSKISDEQIKQYPKDDLNPPVSESDEYYDPVPVPGLVNTAGGEDSAFILPSGDILYFFFTPDVRVPIEEQVIDEVTGIYVSNLLNGEWSEPTRVLLQNPDKLALDGCEILIDDTIYFCSAREGYTGLHWFKAEKVDGVWSNWTCIDPWLKTFENEIGELHFSADMHTLYFHSDREGGKGLRDIWKSDWTNGGWGEPANLEVINTESDEGWPCLSPDGSELWFSRDYGIWCSLLVDGKWGEPERMFFPLAGEPTVDAEGNVYFTHHFYEGDIMLEADIYVAHKKP